MTVTYRIDHLKQRQPSETDPLLEALCNSPEFIRDDIQDNINEQVKLKEIIAYNREHIEDIKQANRAHEFELTLKASELMFLRRKLVCTAPKIAGGAQ